MIEHLRFFWSFFFALVSWRFDIHVHFFIITFIYIVNKTHNFLPRKCFLQFIQTILNIKENVNSEYINVIMKVAIMKIV